MRVHVFDLKKILQRNLAIESVIRIDKNVLVTEKIQDFNEKDSESQESTLIENFFRLEVHMNMDNIDMNKLFINE